MKTRASVKSNERPLRAPFLKLQARRLHEAKKEIKELERTIARIKKQNVRARALWKEIDALDKRIWKTRHRKRGI